MPPLLEPPEELPPDEEPPEDEPPAEPLELPMSLEDEPLPALPVDDPVLLPKPPLELVLPVVSEALPELLAPPLAPAPAAPA